jgi:hypothetical protein
MGVVYEAQQVSLGRRVALKVLPFATVMDQRRLARFKTEAQAAAQLIHQNIVPVFSVGCERGVHFYAMQYVEGQTLAEIIGQLRRAVGLEPREPDEPRALAASASISLAHLAASACDSDDANRETQFSPVDPSANTAGVRGSAETAPIAARSTEKSNKDATYFRTVANVGVQGAEALDQPVVGHFQPMVADFRLWSPTSSLVAVAGNQPMFTGVYWLQNRSRWDCELARWLDAGGTFESAHDGT